VTAALRGPQTTAAMGRPVQRHIRKEHGSRSSHSGERAQGLRLGLDRLDDGVDRLDVGCAEGSCFGRWERALPEYGTPTFDLGARAFDPWAVFVMGRVALICAMDISERVGRCSRTARLSG
jgi:hypothetical protein